MLNKMTSLNILLFLAALLVYVNADDTYGNIKQGSTRLVADAQLVKKATITFNNNGKYAITIDKVVVSYTGISAKSSITKGGPGHEGVTLSVESINEKSWVGVAIYGRWKRKKNKKAIYKTDVVFNAVC